MNPLKYNKHKVFKTKVMSFAICMFIMSSCEDSLEVDAPFGQIPDTAVFESEALATSALTTIYSKLREEVLLNGTNSGLSVTMGYYADELDYYGNPSQTSQNFYQHTILPTNTVIRSFWNNSYNIIYRVNAVIEGLENSTAISQETKSQLRGEALFIRALCHFYLVNLFNDIPYITTTDYRINSEVSRTEASIVYELIVQDLQEAKSLIATAYMTSERTRPNAATVSALLARVYLYQEAWDSAVEESSIVINNTALYQLESNLQVEFLKQSRSTIWHFKPKTQGFNTNEASTFTFNSGPPPSMALTNSLVMSMEPNDLRKTYWIREVTNGTNTWFHAYKYKSNQNTGTSVEYSIAFRLSEQYLIRSEARAMLGDVDGALNDLNTIRNRAGLNDVATSVLEEFKQLLLLERQHELFTEHGHRWFDLKRLGYADEILEPLKDGWSINNLNFPIPEVELLINPNLNPQNPGY